MVTTVPFKLRANHIHCKIHHIIRYSCYQVQIWCPIDFWLMPKKLLMLKNISYALTLFEHFSRLGLVMQMRQSQWSTEGKYFIKHGFSGVIVPNVMMKNIKKWKTQLFVVSLVVFEMCYQQLRFIPMGQLHGNKECFVALQFSNCWFRTHLCSEIFQDKYSLDSTKEINQV